MQVADNDPTVAKDEQLTTSKKYMSETSVKINYSALHLETISKNQQKTSLIQKIDNFDHYKEINANKQILLHRQNHDSYYQTYATDEINRQLEEEQSGRTLIWFWIISIQVWY